MKKVISWMLVLAMMISLSACGQQAQIPEETQPEEGPVLVSTVDELLDAIAPGAVIQLGEGEFCLSEGTAYGKGGSPYYTWNDYGLGEFELQLQNLDGLTILGSGKDKTALVTDPRWANVLSVKDCRNITLEAMTVGHTEMTEGCEGGVIRLDGVQNTTLSDLGLYGCGTLGVMTIACDGLTMRDCEVYDCSIGGLQLYRSQDIRIAESSFHSLGKEMPVMHVFNVSECENVEITDCTISDNYVQNLLWANTSGGVALRNNRITGNRLSSGMFSLQMPGVVLDGNVFEENTLRHWYAPSSYETSYPAVDPEGNEIEFEEDVEETMPLTPGVANPVSTGEQKTVRVSTVEQFLDAIGSDTCIILEAELLDFSDCREYQKAVEDYPKFESHDACYYPEGRKNHYWINNFDGPSLVIYDVNNMTILAEGEDRKAHTLSAVPRYAYVLTFEFCTAITLSGFTAGHTMEPGQCTGGVFLLKNCEDVLIDNCGMYGCGTEGVYGEYSRNIQIVNSEIYECSYTGIELDFCENVAISGTIIRDIANEWDQEPPFFNFYGSSNVTLDGEVLDGNYVGR